MDKEVGASGPQPISGGGSCSGLSAKFHSDSCGRVSSPLTGLSPLTRR